MERVETAVIDTRASTAILLVCLRAQCSISVPNYQ